MSNDLAIILGLCIAVPAAVLSCVGLAALLGPAEEMRRAKRIRRAIARHRAKRELVELGRAFEEGRL